MHGTQNALANHEYRNVPITAPAESATNPRKRFHPKTSKNWPPAPRPKAFWPLFWYANCRKAVRGCRRDASSRSEKRVEKLRRLAAEELRSLQLSISRSNTSFKDSLYALS